jgi:hypothetical protein
MTGRGGGGGGGLKIGYSKQFMCFRCTVWFNTFGTYIIQNFFNFCVMLS